MSCFADFSQKKREGAVSLLPFFLFLFFQLFYVLLVLRFGNARDFFLFSHRNTSSKVVTNSIPLLFLFYSVRSAMTGSFFAAAEAGISPEIRVSITLTSTITSADDTGSAASPAIPVRGCKMQLTTREIK